MYVYMFQTLIGRKKNIFSKNIELSSKNIQAEWLNSFHLYMCREAARMVWRVGEWNSFLTLSTLPQSLGRTNNDYQEEIMKNKSIYLVVVS